jgi:mRNA interferase MazF
MARGTVCLLKDDGLSTRRPVVVVQSDAFNRSRIPTVVIVPLSSRLVLGRAPGNVPVPARHSGLLGDTVAIVSSPQTLERRHLNPTASRLPHELLDAIDQGLRLVVGA